MGTCISKCMPSHTTPAQQPSCLPRDKPVVSQSPCIVSSVRVSSSYHCPSSSSTTTSSSSCVSSSSSYSTSSSIRASSLSSTSTSNYECCMREPPCASAGPRPRIVVLDPGSCNFKHSPSAPSPVDLLEQAPGAFPKRIEDAQRKTQLPKRERSTSPALVRHKSFRSSPAQSSAVPTRSHRQFSPCRPVTAVQATQSSLWTRSPSPVVLRRSAREFEPNNLNLGCRNLPSPSPARRLDRGRSSGVRAKFMRPEEPSGHKLATEESKTEALTAGLASRMQRLRRGSSTSVPGLLHAPRWRRRETSVHPVAVPLEQETAGMISDNDYGLAQIEDMDNPLIALDCFIFI